MANTPAQSKTALDQAVHDDPGNAFAVSALGGFCSIEKRDEIKQFFATHRAPGAERALQQSLERISTCVEFKQLQGENMRKVFEQYQ